MNQMLKNGGKIKYNYKLKYNDRSCLHFQQSNYKVSHRDLIGGISPTIIEIIKFCFFLRPKGLKKIF